MTTGQSCTSGVIKESALSAVDGSRARLQSTSCPQVVSDRWSWRPDGRPQEGGDPGKPTRLSQVETGTENTKSGVDTQAETTWLERLRWRPQT